jgi:hypothetical protein
MNGVIFGRALAGTQRHAFCSFTLTWATKIEGSIIMNLLWALAVILVIAWVAGFTLFHVTSGLLHLLLVFAVIAVVARIVSGRRV